MKKVNALHVDTTNLAMVFPNQNQAMGLYEITWFFMNDQLGN